MSAETVSPGLTPEQASAVMDLVHALRALGAAHTEVERLAQVAMDTGLWRIGQEEEVCTPDEQSVAEMVGMIERVRADLLRMILVPLGAPHLAEMMGIDKPN